LSELKPDAVFNLVDSVEGKGDLSVIAPLLLEHMGVPFTGANSIATSTSSHKIVAKQILRGASLPTGAWFDQEQIAAREARIDKRFILKSVTEHASFGMFAGSVVGSEEALFALWEENRREYWGDWFAEEFIDGREFNIGCIATRNGPLVTPPAEIVFTADFPKDAPRIVDYTAKWKLDAPEYKGTVRRLDFPPEDATLLKRLEELVLACWHAFGMDGYTRVDFRIDEKGNPFVLEVNANPFLTAGEGLGVAAARAGFSFPQLLDEIVTDALTRGRRQKQVGAAA